MTRRTIVDLQAFITAALPNNITQDISPGDVRECFRDMGESITPVFASIDGSHVGLAIPLTTTPIKLPGSFFTNAISGNPAWAQGRANPNGDILIGTSIGRLLASLDVVFNAPAGQNIAFTIARNGVLAPSRTIVTAEGIGNPVAGAFTWAYPTVAVNDVFDVWVGMVAGSTTMNLMNAAFRGILQPQYS
jgi:hypothetical protein